MQTKVNLGVFDEKMAVALAGFGMFYMQSLRRNWSWFSA